MQVEKNISLLPFNTFHIHVEAGMFCRITTIDEAREAVAIKAPDRLVLGGGSNILLTRNFDGLVIKTEIPGVEKIAETPETVTVRVGAGQNWHGFVQWCIAHGYGGVENLSLIPGCVGAAPMQNIGAYGAEISHVCGAVHCLQVNDGQMLQLGNSDCRFGYRESIFKHELKDRVIITHVDFQLQKQPVFNTSYGAIEAELDAMGVSTLSLQAVSEAVIRIRQSKLPDPAVVGNAGSFFKNPVIPATQFDKLKQVYPSMPAYQSGALEMKVPAAWLIEQAGWKGYRLGDAGVHTRQALVLVNYKQATGCEILHLSQQIIDSVQQKFGISLQREVNIV
jgi:UDP-N-acetylmuramate dehydrogenase